MKFSYFFEHKQAIWTCRSNAIHHSVQIEFENDNKVVLISDFICCVFVLPYFLKSFFVFLSFGRS